MNATIPTDHAADPYGLVGSVLGGHRVEVLLDANGSGLVYSGASVATKERVAIKVLRVSSEGADRTALLARFADETRTLRAVAEGNADVVPVRATGEISAPRTGEVVPFLVYEWIDGTLLSSHLAERRERKMPGRTLAEALDLVETAALAIAHAHALGVVHRDVRPANLILARLRHGTHLKVLDFGVAQTLGTVHPDYAAPEQQPGTRGLVGPWTDIRALVLVLLELMTGELARDPKHVITSLDMPRGVCELLLRAVAEDPHERPAHAGLFWSALRELARTHVVSDAALAPTDADEASEQVRKARLEITRQAPAASPFNATMLMVGAPNGSIRAIDIEEAPGSTAPLAMPVAEGAHPVSPHAMSVGLASPLAASIGLGHHPSPASPASPVTFAMAAKMQHPAGSPAAPPPPSALPQSLQAHPAPALSSAPPQRPRSAPPPPPAAPVPVPAGTPGKQVFLLGLAVGVSVTVALLAVLYWVALRT